MLKRIVILAVSLVFIATTFALACLAFRDHDAPHPANSAIVDSSIMVLPEPTPDTTTAYQGSIIFMGDTMLARSVGAGIQNGNDPYQYVKDELAKHSLRVANIETTIADPSVAITPASKTYTFNAPLASLDVLKTNAIDVSALANNHTGDYGSQATADMLKQFQNKELFSVGIGTNTAEAFRPLVVPMRLQNPANTNDTTTAKIGFISVNDIELAHTKAGDNRPGGAYFDIDRITQSVIQARNEGAALVFVLPHWGIEYQSNPSARQVDWAKRFLDAGADGVIGSHPHVVQSTTFYKDKPVVYSLGNFIFDGMEGSATIGQMIVLPITLAKTNGSQNTIKITLEKPKSIKIEINNLGYPVIAP